MEDYKPIDKKVLVVDDEEGIRKYVKAILSKHNYSVAEAVDGEQAIEKILNEEYEFVICDIKMPKMSGWDVLRVVRSNPASKEIPILILTGLNDNKDMVKAYDWGANYYITKPFTPSQLFYGIRVMLEEVENYWKV